MLIQRPKVVGGFPVDINNLCHTTFTDNPSTWRMSSVAPNLQNIPRGTDSQVQHWVKEMFVAPEGWVVGSRDYSGIEARLVGYLANDRNLYRLTALGVHDFYGLNLLYADKKIPFSAVPQLSWSDADLKACFLQYKKDCGRGQRFEGHRDISKRVIYLSFYKGTPLKMHQEYPESFPTTKFASQRQRFLFELFPSIPTWHETLCLQVDKTTFIRTPFGYIHRFHQVLSWEKDGAQWVHKFGDDAKRLIAYVPQNTASGILKEAAIRLSKYDIVMRFMRLFIHDDITGICPKEEWPEVDRLLKFEMEQPVKCLPLDPSWGMGEYVVVNTEEKVGPSWGSQK